MTRYTVVTAVDRPDGDPYIFLHARADRYGWAEIVDAAAAWGEIVEDVEPHLTVQVVDVDGRHTIDLTAVEEVGR